MNDLVSVILPTTGRLNKLKRAIRSLYNQTMLDYEIIIINDGCNIEVSKYLENIKDSRLVVINGNYGSGAISRNVGIGHSKGKYITFLDDDDMFEQDKLAKQVESFKQVSCDVVLCGSKTLEGKVKKLLPKHHDITLELKKANPYYITMMCKAEVLKENLMDQSLPNYQDWDLLVRFVKNNVSMSYIPEALYIIDDGDHKRISNTVGFNNVKMDERLKALKKHRQWLGEHHFNNRCFKEEMAYIKKRDKKLLITINAVRKYGVQSCIRYMFRIAVNA